MLLLGNIPEEFLARDNYLIKIFLAASKKAIMRRWYQQDPPTKDNWMDIIKEIYILRTHISKHLAILPICKIIYLIKPINHRNWKHRFQIFVYIAPNF